MNAQAVVMENDIRSGSVLFDGLIPSNPHNWTYDPPLSCVEYKISHLNFIAINTSYYLSSKEQEILRHALRSSVKILHKA